MPPGVRHAAQHGHRELAKQNHDHHPGGRQLEIDERDQRGGHEELVGQRVHPLPEARDLLAAPGEEAVEPIGQRRDAKDDGAQQLFAHPEELDVLRIRQQDNDEQRDQKDSSDRDRVRKVHSTRCYSTACQL